MWDLGRQVPDCYSVKDPSDLDTAGMEEHRIAAQENRKVSDLLYTVPNIPHLLNVKISVEYRELCETMEETKKWVKDRYKWRDDPGAERYGGHAPRRKYYVNGEFVSEDMPTTHQISNKPFPEIRVPRRGLVQVTRDDPDYERICKEQGLEHLLKGRQTPSLPNGVHSSPASQTSTVSTQQQPLVNGTKGHSIHDSANGLKVMNGDATVNGVDGSGTEKRYP